MSSLTRSSVVLLLLCCCQSYCARGAPMQDREGVVLDGEGSSSLSLHSYSSVPKPAQESDNNGTTSAPGNTLPSTELVAAASSHVIEITPSWESSVNMETHIQPVSPTPSSQYHSPISTPSVSPNGGPGNGVPNNDSVPGLEDPMDHCTFPFADEIALFPPNPVAMVVFTLSTQDHPVCQSGVYGVRLAMWTSSVTNGDTVYYNMLQWGPWVLGTLPDNYSPGQHFSTTHADVTMDEAYYAQVAIGKEEDFIDSFTAPPGDVISNVTFLGAQEPLQVKANRSITVYEGDPIRLFCAAQGNPTPSVSLFRDVDNRWQNDGFQHVEKIFVISKAMPEDSGSVLCIASQYFFRAFEPRPTPTTAVSIVPITVTVIATSPTHSFSNTSPATSATASMTMASASSTAMPTPSPTSSCSEVPWAAAVCSRLSLSQGRVIPFGGAESGPSVTSVVEAVAQLESSQVHTQECLDAVKQLLCLRHFSPCEDGNQIAPGRPVCGSECTELFTGRCQDTWAAYLGYVDQTSGAYKDHIEGCTGGGNDQECATLLPPSSEPPPTANDITIPVMAAVLALGILGMLILSAIVAVVLVRRNRKLTMSFLRPWDKDSTPLALPYVFNEDYYKSKYGLVPNSRLFSITREDIELQEVIGEGHFGTVHKATIKGLEVDTNPQVVAAKTLKLGSTDEGMKDFLQEARLMSHLEHPNIVRLFGISMSQEPFVLIFEYMEGGDLKEFVQQRAGCMERRLIFPDKYLNRNDSTSSTDPPGLSVSELINICHQVACGMEYIASRGQVHRDLAARNCLVGVNMVVKIGDFGLSRSLYSKHYIRDKSGTDLPVRWIAPESLLTGTFRLHSDVWSFGVVMWEVFTFGHLPYYGRGNEEIVNLVCSGSTLDRPLNCNGSVYAVMKSCWQLDPLRRPTFAQLVGTLQDCLVQHHEEETRRPSTSASLLSDIEEVDDEVFEEVFTDDEADRRQEENSAEGRGGASETEGNNQTDNRREEEDVDIAHEHLPVKV